MGAIESRHQSNRDLINRDSLSSQPHALTTLILDMLLPKWALRYHVDNNMWNKRQGWWCREQMAMWKDAQGFIMNREVFSGSSVEGIGLPYTFDYQPDRIIESDVSDFDSLLVDSKRQLATDVENAVNNNTHLAMDLRHTYYGFTRIQVIYPEKELTKYCTIRNIDGKDVTYLKTNMLDEIDDRILLHLGKAVPTGPALTQDTPQQLEFEKRTPQTFTCNVVLSTDNVYAIRCPSWPDIALPWFKRARPSSWPSEETMAFIFQCGLHVVAVSHKLTMDPDIEWRLSYSGAEVILANSLTLQQRQVYIILKYLSKVFLKGKPGFFSYLLKTVFFWTCEEVEEKFWTPSNLSMCLFAVIDKMIHFLAEGHIPNYFIPQSNLIGHLPSDHMTSLFSAVVDMRSNPLRVIHAQANMRLIFHGTKLGNLFQPIVKLVDDVDWNMVKYVGFIPFIRLLETTFVGMACFFHTFQQFYPATHTLEHYLRQYWTPNPSDENIFSSHPFEHYLKNYWFSDDDIDITFALAHKRRMLYYKFQRKCDAKKSLTIQQRIHLYSEASCRIDNTEGFNLMGRIFDWQDQIDQTISQWTNQMTAETKIHKDTRKSVEHGKSFLDDAIPGKIFQPKPDILYPPLLNGDYHRAVLATCHANQYLVQAMQPENHEKAMIQGIRLMMKSYKVAPTDPCILAEFVNMICFIHSLPRTQFCNNILSEIMEMYNSNCGAERSLTNQVLTHVTHVLTNNSLPETQKELINHESPILEPNLAAMLIQETCEISIPYDMYLAFLAIVLQGYVTQHQTDENNSKASVLLSYLETVTEMYCKRLRENAKVPQDHKQTVLSIFHFLTGIAYIYNQQYKPAHSAFIKAAEINNTRMQSLYQSYAAMATTQTVKIWTHNSSQVGTPKQTNSQCENINEIKSPHRNPALTDTETAMKNALHRLQHVYNLGSDMDKATFSAAFLDLFLVMLPSWFNLREPIHAELLSTACLNEVPLD